MLHEIGERSQITLNKSIREALGISGGDKLLVTVLPDGRAELKVIKSKPLASLAGSLRSFITREGPEALDVDESLRQVAAQRVAEKYDRVERDE